MKIKASGRSALMIAAAIWACLWGPLQAGDSAAKAATDITRAGAAQENRAAANAALKRVAKHRARHARKYARLRPHKAAAVERKPAREFKLAQAEIDADDADGALPRSIANAHAQLAAADIAAGDGMLAKADKARLAAQQDDAKNPLASPAEIVAADELNDLDLAAAEDRQKQVPARIADVAAASTDDPWSKTSLIGKIFIAFGGLLTLASAARMFMA
jgi:hypothetical protein